MQFFFNFLRGIVIGIAEIIPGISGGTMAVLMNIYSDLIAAISNFKQQFKQSFFLLFPLLLGMGMSILALSHIIKNLLLSYPMQMNFLFLGLILGIIPMLFRKATTDKVQPINVIPLIVMLTIMLCMTWISFRSGTISNTVITVMSIYTFGRFLLVGFLAAICLILPGISGSMVMVIFGVYDSVIVAISSLHLIMLLPIAIGILLGITLGSKILSHLLQNFSQPTYFAICGLVCGSTIPLFLRALILPATFITTVYSVIFLFIGIFISLLFTSNTFVRHKKTTI